jgi:metal-responsive CopG/Arc/MetJ family transcriptional regulator
MTTASTRVNLHIPLDLAIQIEKECDKIGMNRTQFIKQILYEKVQKMDNDNNKNKNNIESIAEEISDIKKLLFLLVNTTQKERGT